MQINANKQGTQNKFCCSVGYSIWAFVFAKENLSKIDPDYIQKRVILGPSLFIYYKFYAKKLYDTFCTIFRKAPGKVHFRERLIELRIANLENLYL